MPSERPTGRWTLIALISTASFINYLDRGSLSVAMPVISKELHLDPIAQGAALSAFFWTYTAMQIPMGRIVDRYSIKVVYAVSFAVWSLAAAATTRIGPQARAIRSRYSGLRFWPSCWTRFR